jgi:hypothetical protein
MPPACWRWANRSAEAIDEWMRPAIDLHPNLSR